MIGGEVKKGMLTNEETQPAKELLFVFSDAKFRPQKWLLIQRLFD